MVGCGQHRTGPLTISGQAFRQMAGEWVPSGSFCPDKLERRADGGSLMQARTSSSRGRATGARAWSRTAAEL